MFGEGEGEGNLAFPPLLVRCCDRMLPQFLSCSLSRAVDFLPPLALDDSLLGKLQQHC